MKEAVSLLFEQPPWGEGFAYTCQEGRRGDRWERRRLWASAALNDYLGWPGLGQVCCVERTRRHKGREHGGAGLRHHQPAAGTGGCRPAAGDLAGPLGNRKPAALGADVVFGGDRSQVRTGSAPQLLAALRNFVIGMLRLGGVKNISAALRHYGWKAWETLLLIGLPRHN